MKNTKKLYNKNSSKWKRDKPTSLSDFTGRPPVVELCGNVNGKRILDLGCGEGYVSRILLKGKPKTIDAIDISYEMINEAKKQNHENKVSFKTGSAVSLKFKQNYFDIVVCVFLYNYLSISDMKKSFKEVYRVLKKGGLFIFCVPHPSLPFMKRKNKKGFHFDFKDKGYFSARDIFAEGSIERIDKIKLPVQMNHKLFEDYFDTLVLSGFKKIPKIKELTIKKEHIKKNKTFFKRFEQLPLHLAFQIKK